MIIPIANPRKYPLLSRLWLLVIALTLLAGCGFEPRGDFAISSTRSFSIEGSNHVFNEQLIERLQQSGVMVVAANSDITLSISTSEYQRRVRTIDITGLATSYDYTYTVDYQVRDSDRVVLQPLATIYQHQTLNFDSAQVLQIEAEETFLKRQMEQEIILQLLRRLSQITGVVIAR